MTCRTHEYTYRTRVLHHGVYANNLIIFGRAPRSYKRSICNGNVSLSHLWIAPKRLKISKSALHRSLGYHRTVSLVYWG